MGSLMTDEPYGAGSRREDGASRPRTTSGPDERRLAPRLRLRIPRDAHAAATARRALARLEEGLTQDVLDTLRLLVTELVTNSVRHADAPGGSIVDLDIAVAPGRLRVEVGDGGSGFDAVPRAPDQDRASGWGLHLVNELADRWGVRGTPATSVWFEIDLQPHLRCV